MGVISMTNKKKLQGKIVECGYTLTSFSAAMGLSRVSLRKKLNGTVEFRESEIKKAMTLLSIPAAEIETYFFTE